MKSSGACRPTRAHPTALRACSAAAIWLAVVLYSEVAHASPARGASFSVGVRHEVVQVAVGTAISSTLTAIWQDSTRCSAIGILSRHASSGKPSLRGRWRGVKPWRQSRHVRKNGSGNGSGNCYCQYRAVKAARVAGMVNVSESLQASRVRTSVKC